LKFCYEYDIKNIKKLLFVKFLLYYIWSPHYKGHKDLDVIYFQKALLLSISLFNFYKRVSLIGLKLYKRFEIFHKVEVCFALSWN